jgi:serine kinase of HPr protein (carbohydrate metabolism regulator)
MSANIHASCVALGGKGVLLLGASGAGKSDLALRLIDGGARLVADDRCEIFVRAGKLCARAPDSIAGLIEMRGQGVIALPHAKSVIVAMAVRLGASPARLPEPAFYSPPPGIKLVRPVPLIMVKAAAASAPARIRAALAAFSQDRFRDTFNPKSRT